AVAGSARAAGLVEVDAFARAAVARAVGHALVVAPYTPVAAVVALPAEHAAVAGHFCPACLAACRAYPAFLPAYRSVRRAVRTPASSLRQRRRSQPYRLLSRVSC